jgi:hypothetical protein
MRQVGKSKKDSRRRSDSVSTANTARRDYRGSPPYGKMHTNRGGRVRGNTEISQNGEEAFHYRRQATYASHLGQRHLERLWLFQLVLRLNVTIW